MRLDKERVICFDLGSTLEDETPAQVERMRTVSAFLESRGILLDPDTLLSAQERAGQRNEENILNAALLDLGLSPELIAETRVAVPWNARLCRAYPAAKDVLIKVAASGSRLVLIANQSKPVAERLFGYGMAKLFDLTLISCECGISKPDPRLFMKAGERFGPGAEYWMVGDRVDNDILPAKDLGWKTVRVRQGTHRLYIEKNEDERADYVVESIADVGKIKELTN
jgi:FMN phosphatase YigB (HAD superfamily)